jgi:fatty-acyl-CoA synthase
MPEFPLTNAYWPAQTFAPLRETTIGSILCDAAAVAPDKIALIDGDPVRGKRRQWTYLALLADAERAARALLQRFSPGAHCGLLGQQPPVAHSGVRRRPGRAHPGHRQSGLPG